MFNHYRFDSTARWQLVTLFGIFDAPDDLTQRRLGRGVAEELSHAASPSPEFIEVKARQVGLF